MSSNTNNSFNFNDYSIKELASAEGVVISSRKNFQKGDAETVLKTLRCVKNLFSKDSSYGINNPPQIKKLNKDDLKKAAIAYGENYLGEVSFFQKVCQWILSIICLGFKGKPNYLKVKLLISQLRRTPKKGDPEALLKGSKGNDGKRSPEVLATSPRKGILKFKAKSGRPPSPPLELNKNSIDRATHVTVNSTGLQIIQEVLEKDGQETSSGEENSTGRSLSSRTVIVHSSPEDEEFPNLDREDSSEEGEEETSPRGINKNESFSSDTVIYYSSPENEEILNLDSEGSRSKEMRRLSPSLENLIDEMCKEELEKEKTGSE